jgi:hypothetical protein
LKTRRIAAGARRTRPRSRPAGTIREIRQVSSQTLAPFVFAIAGLPLPLP